MTTIDPDGMYLVTWPDESTLLLFGYRLIRYPVGNGAKITRLIPEPEPIEEPGDTT